ncbi:GNAT family N-acetyltransferase [Prevotella sp. E15-22]|uniref:GNAT family N-acetyltransferase n=1 Tax=Prevotella sp. E15-22 TaxID=2937774 RepID=UPI002059D893|nr:GNAT family N-acetyltransferase [Prevotella sp. E15-22]UPS45276.1 GNAT family N-acetyltransferase [Prevotella sp. E15-22]
MKFYTKKTIELSREEKESLIKLYNETFDEKRTLEEFDRQFLNNPLGYSYHTIGDNDGEIISSNTMIPAYYTINGKKLLFVCSVDTMVDKNHRGIENFYDTSKESFRVSEEIGAKAVYGFPNDNSYTLFTKLKFMKDIGKLKTYCLPYRIGGIKPSMTIFNIVSILFCRLWISISSLFASRDLHDFTIEKESDSYNATRYKRADANYVVAGDKGCQFAYKIMNYDGIRTAFLIDVFNKSAKNFCKAVNYIVRNEENRFDLLLYVGDLPFSHYGMVKIPKKFEPKDFNFTGAIIDKEAISKEAFFNQSNWDVNLSNYDLL